MAFTLTRKTKPDDPQKVIQDCLRKRDYKGAIPAFEQILKESPSGTQMRMRYADTLVLAGRKADAIKHYNRVAEEFSESGYLVRAIAIYKKIVKLDPSATDILEKLARLDADRGVGDDGEGFSIGSSSAGTGPIELPEDGDDELDIGGGFDLGGPISSPATRDPKPSQPPPEPEIDFAPDDLPMAPAKAKAPVAADLGGDDLAPDDLGEIGDDLAPDDLSPATDDLEAPVSVADFSAAAAGDDLAPDDLSPEEPVGDFAESTAAAAEGLPSMGDFSFGDSAPTTPAQGDAAAPATLDFGFGGAARATDADAGADVAPALNFSFGDSASEIPAQADATPAAPHFDFGGDAATAAGSDAGEATPAMSDDPFGMGQSGSFVGPTDEETDDLLALLGDDIESMIDGIIDDVGSATANAPLEMQQAETNIPLLSHLAIDEFIEILKVLDRQTAKLGKEIVKEGEAGSSMFIISSGEVTASVNKDGRSVTMATLRDGDFFGEMAVLSSTPRSATITATKNTELLVLERSSLQEIFSRHPEIEAKLRLAHDERTEKRSSFE